MTLLRNEDLFSLVAPHLNRRAVFGVGSTRIFRREDLLKITLERGLANGWVVLTTESFTGDHYIICDQSAALVSRPTGECVLIEDNEEVNLLCVRFEKLWDTASSIDLLYSDSAGGAGSTTTSIFLASAEKWNELIRKISQNPVSLYTLDPSYFEEFVAELLQRQGLTVQLTPRTRDGGKDILAYLDSPVGRALYYVECKRYAPDRPIGVSLVRQLYGVVEAERATAGLLVTTSSFTSDALAFRELVRHRLTLKDYESLVSWLRLVR